MSRRSLLFPTILAVLAGCQDLTSPEGTLRPQFAQGDGGVWTVNSLADPGDGTCDDAECTLREAIAAAAAGGRIAFAAGISGQIDLGAQLLITKDLEIDGDNRITLSGQNAVRVLGIQGTLAERITVHLEELNINDGLTAEYESGGGILAVYAELSLDDVGFDGNEADDDGGALAMYYVDATISNGRFVDNQAGWFGGGIGAAWGSLTVVDSWFTDNSAFEGGGIWLGPDARISLVGATLNGNTAQTGGAMYTTGTADPSTIERSTISGNTATGSMGIGGVRSMAQLSIRNSTIVLNSGEGGGGLYNGGSMLVANSIVVANEGGFGLFNCSGPAVIQSAGYNIFGPSCSFSGTGDIGLGFYIDPFTEVLERELANNGGPTKTHALLARGRAVDAGYCPGVAVDQRGYPRPVDDPAMPNALDGCDIGAYELQGPLVPVADLMISQSVDKTSVKQGDLLTYTIRVQNLGPQTAPTVVVNDVLSSGVTFVAIAYNKGNHTAPPAGETGTVTWYLGDMADQANEVAEIKVTVLVKGKATITNTATVAGAVTDPNEANNTAAITVSVGAGGSSGGGRKPR